MISKVIIPVAGKGSRFLPLTRVLPKEMIPLVDRPAVHFALDEAVRAGVKDVILVSNSSKQLVEDYLRDYATAGPSIPNAAQRAKDVRMISVQQESPLGLGHAVFQAGGLINDNYFGVVLPDDILLGTTPCIGLMARIAQQERGTVLAVREVNQSEVSSYGVIEVKRQISPTLFQVKDIVEKPSESEAPSRLAVVGRYVFNKALFEHTDIDEGVNNEIQLTDAIREMLAAGERVFAYKVQQTLFDVGTPAGYINAFINMALRHKDYSDATRRIIAELDCDQAVLEGDLARMKKVQQ